MLNIRQAREEAGLSRADVFRTLQQKHAVSLSTIKRAEAGDPRVSVHNVALILWVINKERERMGLDPIPLDARKPTFRYRPTLREVYTERGWNRKRMAQEAQMTLDTLTRIEAGNGVLPRTLEKALHALNTGSATPLAMSDIDWRGADAPWREAEAKRRGVHMIELSNDF